MDAVLNNVNNIRGRGGQNVEECPGLYGGQQVTRQWEHEIPWLFFLYIVYVSYAVFDNEPKLAIVHIA